MEEELYKVGRTITELLDVVDTLISIIKIDSENQESFDECEYIMKKLKNEWYPIKF